MIKGFMVYDNYYYLINVVEEDKQKELEHAMFKYMFEDIEPNFDKDKQLKGIWINLKMPLDTSKKQSINGSKGGRPKSQKKTQKETQSKSQKKANNISTFIFHISNFNNINNNNLLISKIEEWINYKKENKFEYTEIGLKTLLKQIDTNCEKHGFEEIINLIDESMANGYKGIIFKNLKDKPKKTNNPKWFNKQQEDVKATEEEIEEMNSLLSEFKQEVSND